MRLAAEIGELQPTDPNQMPSRGRLPIRRRNPCLGRCSLLAILAKISTPPKKRGSRVASFSIAYALENAVTSLCRGKRRINQRFPSRFSIDNLFGKRVPNYTHANRRRTPVRMARKRRPDRRESVGAKPSHTLCAAANSRFPDHPGIGARPRRRWFRYRRGRNATQGTLACTGSGQDEAGGEMGQESRP